MILVLPNTVIRNEQGHTHTLIIIGESSRYEQAKLDSSMLQIASFESVVPGATVPRCKNVCYRQYFFESSKYSITVSHDISSGNAYCVRTMCHESPLTIHIQRVVCSCNFGGCDRKLGFRISRTPRP